MIFDFLGYEFMQRAIVTGAVAAVCCSMLGLYLVLKRYSLFGDALSHTAFTGIAIGYVLNVYPVWTATIVSVVSAIGVTRLRKSTKISGDSAIALMFASGLGLGVILVSAAHGFTIDLYSFLFGSVLLTSYADLATIIVMSSIVIGILVALRKPLLHFTFDEEQAKVNGVPVERLTYLFIILAAVTVIVTMKLVGILLISALIVLPNITSITVGRGFRNTMLLSISLGLSATVGGIILSYPLNWAPSGVIVMLLVGMFLGALAAKHAGLLSKGTGAETMQKEADGSSIHAAH